ncbi:hypothetical protein EV378_2404 [Pseudonocardia endophytica]|uniref:Uncharacterized protein n=1 Tax=Pseudonocardia endophytica TaxID=401976 RepID=A0A4V2PIZ4_PSEEN|nr:hypothetical protein EV378_2404 [Pseudonocardia endophytica]
MRPSDGACTAERGKSPNQLAPTRNLGSLRASYRVGTETSRRSPNFRSLENS